MKPLPPQRAVRTDRAPAPIGPYSQAVVAGDFVLCSGQVALDPATGALAGGGDIRLETEAVLRNLAAVLEAAGCRPEDVVKTTIFLVDMGDFPAVNEIYGRTFAGGVPPARSTVAVAGLPRGARVEVEAIAVRRQGPESGSP